MRVETFSLMSTKTKRHREFGYARQQARERVLAFPRVDARQYYCSAADTNLECVVMIVPQEAFLAARLSYDFDRLQHAKLPVGVGLTA